MCLSKLIYRVSVLALAISTTAFAVESYSPYVGRAYPMQVYWGDTHLHTKLSFDAFIEGNTLGVAEAYRFARGETVRSDNGMLVKLRRPLDFLVVSDHASNLGLFPALEAGNPQLLHSAAGKRWAAQWRDIKEDPNMARAGSSARWKMIGRMAIEGFVESKDFRHSVWQNVAEQADRYNDPGKFTTFIGYEWTQIFYNLHRVVIFRDAADRAGKVVPFSQYDSSDPEDLWAYLANYEATTGGQVLAIPHNGNLSRGVMFALEDAKGRPLSRRYAQTRSYWEPLFEVTQIKGDSETHPLLSPADEFADFERWTRESLTHSHETIREQRRYTDYDSWIERNRKEGESHWMRKYEYARSALMLGLEQQAQLGVNPFKFGMIGSTDSHTSLSAVNENDFWGKYATAEPKSGRTTANTPMNEKMSAAGYAAVWATENTREALFAAMKRREVYATTGPRIELRFFGGWNYQEEDAFKPDIAMIGYAKGVPMGGDLTHAPKNAAPSFLIRAVKDPDGANLDRVQVVKGWRDINGKLREQVYNVALSDDREENLQGKVPAVGNTVNVADASYTNSIGDPELAVVWRDPNFNKNELAFYYVRVLEIPSPRWTAYDAKFFKLKSMPESIPMVIQERAYSSPIWYTPRDKGQKYYHLISDS